MAEMSATSRRGLPSVISHDLDGLPPREPAAIWALRGQRVVHVGDGDDSRAHGDALSRQPVWIAAAIVALMVVANDVSGVGKELERRHDLRTRERVSSHGDPLLVREGTALAQDVLGHPDLAQVMEQPGFPDGPDLGPPEADGQREAPRQLRHALGMATGVLVLGLESVGEAQKALEHGALDLPVALS